MFILLEKIIKNTFRGEGQENENIDVIMGIST